MTSLSSRWKSEQYRPGLHWNAMEESVKKLKDCMSSEEFERYFSLVHKFLTGTCIQETVEKELAWLPEDLFKVNQALIQKLLLTCNMDTSTFEEYMDDKIPTAERFLPRPANINALFLLHCLKNGVDCPDDDFGVMVNQTLRNSLYNIVEMALRTKKTFKIAENGFLQRFVSGVNDKLPTTLTPRDFFDSLPFYDDVELCEFAPPSLESCEPFCNFYDKMRKLSKYPSDTEK